MARLSTVVNCCLGLDCHTKGRTQEEMEIEEGPMSAWHTFLSLVARGDLLQRYGKTSQGLKRVRLGSQPQCLIGGTALKTDVH